MLTSDIKKTIDNARDILVGKIPNPQAQIEQITIAMIYKFMDDMDLETVEFGGERQYFTGDLEELAWSKLMSSQLGAESRMNLYTLALEKLPLSDSIPKLFRDIFKGSYLPFRDGQTLSLFLKEINDLSYNDSEVLGDGFEYLLSIMGSQGDAGQFRTPRHIIDFIVSVVKPTKKDTILDPACGTAGFLISAFKYIIKVAKDTKQLLTPQERNDLTKNINGYDISPDMVKLALVNLYLHEFKEPRIFEYDTLTNLDRWDNYFDCILANPPFMTPKGGIKPHNKFGVQANRSEVLFVDYIMEHLNSTGRAGVIVPEGIVFQSANAYKELRKKLVDENYLYAVVSLPSGVFQPYSGVKTSILLMDKQLAKKTDKILFVEIQNDGFDLGAQRRPIDKNDLPQATEFISQWQNVINTHSEFAIESKMITLVEKSKIAENEEYNLTASRYKEVVDYSNCKWDMVKLGDVCEFIGGYAFKSNLLTNIKVTEHHLPVIKIGNILKDGTLDITNVQYYDATGLYKYKILKNDILIAMTGATVGKIAFCEYDNLLLNQRNGIIRTKSNISQKFLKYLLFSNKFYEYCQNMAGGGAQGNIAPNQILNYQIPLPPLEVQEEIVKELDCYQAIIDGAQKVVDNWHPTIPINPNWEKVKLGDVCIYEQPTKYIVKSVDYNNEYKVPVLTAGQSFILGYTNENFGIFNKLPVIIFDDFTTTSKYVDFEFKVKSSAIKILSVKQEIANIKFVFYLMQNIKFSNTQHKRYWISEYSNINIPLPSIEEQNQIIIEIKEEEQMINSCKQLIELYKQKIDTKIQSVWNN